MSKDIILRLIGDLGADGANYKALGYGSAVDAMSIDSRMTIANMAVEAGQPACLLLMRKQRVLRGLSYGYSNIIADEDAQYVKEIHYRGRTGAGYGLPASVDEISPLPT